MTPSQAHDAVQEIMTAVENMEPTEHKYPQTRVVTMDVGCVLVHALDMHFRFEWQDDESEELERLPIVDDILAMIGKNLNSNQQRVWEILAQGALKEVLSVVLEKLDMFATEAEQIVNERLTNSRRAPAESTVLELLHKTNYNCRTNSDAKRGSSGVQFNSVKTLFHNSSTAQQTEKTEESLGTQLPADYKEFLSVTNVFGAAFSDIIFESPLFPHSSIRWLTDDEDYFTDLFLDLPDKMFMSIRPRNSCGEPGRTKVGKAILVGSEDIFEL
ncbi:hypothetical protein E8E11_007399 [Didymella keratinophila]|nr:hypothetical protein E8E11_007399 [Didymella keratinophila]